MTLKRDKLAKQSLEYANTHDMLTPVLNGQIYLKETFHKVNTNQVTGEALKKVSVGGKGGFGSQGDARDQDKQVEATSRVMVLSGPSQEAYDHNALLKQKVVYIGDGVERIYATKDGSYGRTWCPSHIFGEKKIKGWVENQLKVGRDYDEFVHSNQLDPADAQAYNEFFKINLEETRALYDELCGYKNAWQYCRDEVEWVDGEWVINRSVKARRYRFTVVNYLNQSAAKGKEVYVPKTGYMTWEASSYNHNSDFYKIMNQYYYVHGEDEQWLAEAISNMERKDCVQFLNYQLGEPKVEDIMEGQDIRLGMLAVDILLKFLKKPSEDLKVIKDRAESLERKRRLESLTRAPKFDDWKIVYNWELTRQGKVMFANESL